jgi:hypothetical protein
VARRCDDAGAGRRCRALLIERNLMIKPDELRALLMKTATSGNGP